MANRDLTRLLLAHGNIQTSPQEVQLLNEQPFIDYINVRTETRPSNNGYKLLLSGYAQHVLELERAAGQQESEPLERLLLSLRSAPRSPKAQKLKGSVTTFKVEDRYF